MNKAVRVSTTFLVVILLMKVGAYASLDNITSALAQSDDGKKLNEYCISLDVKTGTETILQIPNYSTRELCEPQISESYDVDSKNMTTSTHAVIGTDSRRLVSNVSDSP